MSETTESSAAVETGTQLDQIVNNDAPTVAEPNAQPEVQETGQMGRLNSLSNYFDNQDKKEEVPQPKTEDKEPEPTAEPEKETPVEDDKETPAVDPKDAEAKEEDTDDAKPVIIESDFAAYPDDEAEIIADLKTKYPRQSNELTAVAGQAIAQTKALSVQIERIGGEHFIEPYEYLSAALRGEKVKNSDGEMVKPTIMSALAQADPQAAFTNLAESLYTVVGKADEYAESADTDLQAYGTLLRNMREKAFTEYFGVEKMDEVKEALALKKDGWADWTKKSIAEGYPDKAEFDRLLEIHEDPVKKSLYEENQKLKAAEKPKAESKSADTSEFDKAFDTTVTDSIGNVVNSVSLKNSILRDTDKDSDEIKAEKAFLRNTYTNSVKSKFTANGLQESFRRGEASTATFKSSMAKTIDSAIKEAAADKAAAESIANKLYKTTRNSTLVKEKTANDPAKPAAKPTETPERDREKPMTAEERRSAMADYFASNP